MFSAILILTKKLVCYYREQKRFICETLKESLALKDLNYMFPLQQNNTSCAVLYNLCSVHLVLNASMDVWNPYVS